MHLKGEQSKTLAPWNKERWANILVFLKLMFIFLWWNHLIHSLPFYTDNYLCSGNGMGLGCSPELGVCSGGRTGPTFMLVRRLIIIWGHCFGSPPCVKRTQMLTLIQSLGWKREALDLWIMHRWWKFHLLFLFPQRPRLFCDVGSSIFSLGTEDNNDGSNAHSKCYRFQNAFADGLS